jgi:GT2 family glycosyltransferase
MIKVSIIVPVYSVEKYLPRCLNRFDPPEITRLHEIRDYMKQNYPDYRKNRNFCRKKPDTQNG